jgi:glutathione S-transferase
LAQRRSVAVETGGAGTLASPSRIDCALAGVSACQVMGTVLDSLRSLHTRLRDMIELVQFPWSPFCIVQRRILEYAGVRFRITNIPNGDRSLVWKLTRQRYYGVPIVKDGQTVVFEVNDDTQVIAKYLDSKLQLGLFPRELEGVQCILWRYIENEIESAAFKLTDIHWQEVLPKSDQLGFLRHKERKFGRGCLDQWRAQESELLKQLEQRLIPFEETLVYKPFLLDFRPRFVDFDLYGMLGDFLYTGHYALPAAHTQLKKWHRRMSKLKIENVK